MQFAESFPGGVQIFAKALGMSEMEMFKLMEQGKLLAVDVLPKVAKQMKIMANEGGALDEKLRSVRVTQGQFTNELQLAQDKIFRTGYDDGLAGLFKTMTTSLSDNGKTLERIGKVYEKVFNGISHVVVWATQFIQSFFRVLETGWDVIQWGIDNPIKSILLTLPLLVMGFKTLGAAIMAAFRTPLAVITLVVGLIDEIRAYFDDDVKGLFDKGLTPEQSKIEHANRRAMFGRATDADRKLLASQGMSTGIDSYEQRYAELAGVSKTFQDNALGKGLRHAVTYGSLATEGMGNFLYQNSPYTRQAVEWGKAQLNFYFSGNPEANAKAVEAVLDNRFTMEKAPTR